MSSNIAVNLIGETLNKELREIENELDSDVVTIFASIYPDIEGAFSHMLDLKKKKRERLAIILQTDGGYSPTAEKLVRRMRRDYNDISFIIPNYAMSAGTILALSGDRIYMGIDSALGPIDPQINKKIGGENEWVPAVSYMNKFEELVEKSRNNSLSPAEYMMMEKQFNLPELERFKQSIEYTKDLLRLWLSQYKFKDWIDKKTGKPKSQIEKTKRAEEIADILNDQKVWHNHSRQIHRESLTNKVKLQIDNIEDNPRLKKAMDSYWKLFVDFLCLIKSNKFLNSTEYFL
jgi:hypothetical protein